MCAQCSLIAHSKCSKAAPPTCDLRAQLLLYARYAEQGNPTSAYRNPADASNGAALGRAAAPRSEVAYVSHTPRTSNDLPRPVLAPQPKQQPTPQTPQNVSASQKLFAVLKRTRAMSPEPPPPPSISNSPVAQALCNTSDEKANRRPVLRRTKERPPSFTSSGTTPNSLRSSTATDSLSSRHVAGRSDAGTRTSASRFSMLVDMDERNGLKVTNTSQVSIGGAVSEGHDTIPGELLMDDDTPRKRHHSKASGSGCTLQ